MNGRKWVMGREVSKDSWLAIYDEDLTTAAKRVIETARELVRRDMQVREDLVGIGAPIDPSTLTSKLADALAAFDTTTKGPLGAVHLRLLKRGAASHWIGLSDDAGTRAIELGALGELERAGLVEEVKKEWPPGPPSVKPRQITEAGRKALAATDS